MMQLYYIVTVLLMISLAIIIYGLMKGKKLFTCILKVVLVLALIGIACSQEENSEDITVIESIDKPIVLPELQKTASTIDSYIEEFMWRSSIAFFLNDNFTSYLNNTSLNNSMVIV